MKNIDPETETSKRSKALRSIGEALIALAETADPPREDDPWLTLADLTKEGWTRESLKSAAQTGLPVKRGPRGKIFVRRSAVDEWIESRDWKPGPRKVTPTDSLEDAHEATARALGVSR